MGRGRHRRCRDAGRSRCVLAPRSQAHARGQGPGRRCKNCSTPTRRQGDARCDGRGSNVAATPARCIAHAGHRIGASVSSGEHYGRDCAHVIGAYQAATGDLAERLLSALDAAEREGGDIRGRQSAAIVVCAGTRGDELAGRLRICVSKITRTARRLRRLVQLHRAYALVDAAEQQRLPATWNPRRRITNALQLARQRRMAFYAAMAWRWRATVARQLSPRLCQSIPLERAGTSHAAGHFRRAVRLGTDRD
jgi:hypothetical protein